MSIKGWSATAPVAVIFALALCGCGDSKRFTADVQSISFLTEAVPAADAGRLYNVVVTFRSTGGAAHA